MSHVMTDAIHFAASKTSAPSEAISLLAEHIGPLVRCVELVANITNGGEKDLVRQTFAHVLKAWAADIISNPDTPSTYVPGGFLILEKYINDRLRVG